jgi:hypothetical protein
MRQPRAERGAAALAVRIRVGEGKPGWPHAAAAEFGAQRLVEHVAAGKHQRRRANDFVEPHKRSLRLPHNRDRAIGADQLFFDPT